MNRTMLLALESWRHVDGNVNTTADILAWIEGHNKNTHVSIRECDIHDSSFWFYDDYDGEILNRKRSFFSIIGMRRFENGEFAYEQPVIIQPEIGYLGIICREIDGVLNFLMQAKIEPGNVNHVQISPTIQATKSNFTRVHGGRLPAYFDIFEQTRPHQIIYDQIQSEQASRFHKKRNRNIIREITDDIEIPPQFMWMTLGQIKTLMRTDNLVNMDTRTVLSGIPLGGFHLGGGDGHGFRHLFADEAMYRSAMLTNPLATLTPLYQAVNNYKMFHDIRNASVPLHELVDWHIDGQGVTSKKPANFMVRYYDIAISGREVGNWTQPLLKAIGRATFGLICQTQQGIRRFLVALRSEIGTFDKVEIGPAVQQESNHCPGDDDAVESLFRRKLEDKEGIIVDVVLSEEGGRFYHEQNRNAIIELPADEPCSLPHGTFAPYGGKYFWVDYSTLNYLLQINNCLNIQLRNLLSLLMI